jgi:hypothetical protein
MCPQRGEMRSETETGRGSHGAVHFVRKGTARVLEVKPREADLTSLQDLRSIVLPKLAREGARAMFSENGLMPSVMQDVFCADLELRTARELGVPIRVGYQCERDMVLATYECYSPERLYVHDKRFISVVRLLEGDRFLPPDSAKRAAHLQLLLEELVSL